MTTTTERQARAARRGAASAVFAVVSYLAFVVVLLYAVGFVAGVGVPRSVDSGGPRGSAAVAIVVDGLLLTLFAVQHSVMARPAFKRQWTLIVRPHVERSAYVLITSLVLGLMFWQWRPITAEVWHVHPTAARAAVWTLYAIGWLLVVGMTFAIDHLDMLGLRQVWRHRRGGPEVPSNFRQPLPYRLVRHPMMTGIFIAFAATPTMTAGHLLFALCSFGYIVVAVRLEEHDLAAELPEYREYAARTPRFVPRPRR